MLKPPAYSAKVTQHHMPIAPPNPNRHVTTAAEPEDFAFQGIALGISSCTTLTKIGQTCRQSWNVQLWQNSCGRLTLSRVHSCGSSFSSGGGVLCLLVCLGAVVLPPHQPLWVVAPHPVGIHFQINPIVSKIPFHLKSGETRF